MYIKKNYLFTALVCVLLAVGMACAFPHMLQAEAEESENLTYETSLTPQDGVSDNLRWTQAYPISGISDGDPATFVQIEYGGEYDAESGKLKNSFYLDLDLKKVYDISRIAVNWYATSGRCVRYLVSVSVDGKVYTPVADHRENSTESSLIEDVFQETYEGRYVRIEIVGNYRQRDDSRNGYFIISELELNGTLSDHELNQWGELTYTAVASAQEGADGEVSQPLLNSNYPAAHLLDGDTSTLYEIQYSGEFGANGLLLHPFNLTLDLGGLYELKEMTVSPYLGIKGVRYCVLISEDGAAYRQLFDHTSLDEIKTIVDVFDAGSCARYVRLEIHGNFKNDGSHNHFTYFSEIRINGKSFSAGTEDGDDPVKLTYSATAAAQENADGIVTQPYLNSHYPAEHLWDSDTSTLYEIQYSGEYGEDGLLKQPFLLTLDLSSICDLDKLIVSPYLGVKGVKYRVWVSENGKDYTECFDHTDLREIKQITDHFEADVKARYIRLEICGNFKLDGSSNTYTYLSEIEVYGTVLQEETPPDGTDVNPTTMDSRESAVLFICFLCMTLLPICRKKFICHEC